jgi:16S rRNA (adenine1518-N6/adenine1519-N6)-dimethyltransferase
MRPKKSLSQNFLVDEKAGQIIVEALGLEEEDTVLEIGAGQGALTKHLLHKPRRVYAVEIDRRLCAYLEKKFGKNRNLKIVNQDILKTDLKALLGSGSTCKVVGNLPYQITSPVLSLLLDNKKHISLCILMVQKEVALRICASPGSKDWSPLSIGIQIYSDVEILFHLKPASFFPRPKVDSSVIRITFLPESRVPIPDEKLFFEVTGSAFGQRRKMISNSLAANLDLPKKQIEVILKKVGINPHRRAETLSLDEFAALASAVRETRD